MGGASTELCILWTSFPIVVAKDAVTSACTCVSASAYKPPTRKAIVHWATSLLVEVVAKIRWEVKGRKLVLMFDRWIAGTRHYVALQACCTDDNNNYIERILGFRTMVDETKHSADEHQILFNEIMGLHEINMDQVLSFMGDQAKCNEKLAFNFKVWTALRNLSLAA